MSKYRVYFPTSPYSKIDNSRLKDPKFIFRISKKWINKTMNLKKKMRFMI